MSKEQEFRQQIKELVIYILDPKDRDEDVIENYTDTVLLACEEYHKECVNAISEDVKYLQDESKKGIDEFTRLKTKYPRIATIDVIKLMERLKKELDKIQEQLLKQ